MRISLPNSTKKALLGLLLLAIAVIFGVNPESLGLSPDLFNFNSEATSTVAATVAPTSSSLSTSSTAATTTSTSQLYLVTDVVDGDTIKIAIDGSKKTLRLIGIDTPETGGGNTVVECFGKEASQRARDLLLGKNVMIESDATQGDLDKYGRSLRYVFFEDGSSFNNRMIADGYAYEYTYNKPYKYQAQFKASEKAAREGAVGLWNPAACAGASTTIE